MVKRNNEFLMKNHTTRPTSSIPFSKVNAITSTIHIFIVIVLALVMVMAVQGS